MKSRTTVRKMAIVLVAAAGIAGSVTALADGDDNEGPGKAIAQLYELQAAFHAAAGGAGVDAATKATHLREMLEVWTDDAVLVVGSTVYVGLGEPDSSTCAPGSLTICDFFQNHAGSFVLGRNWAALTSLARTHFDVQGNRADVYFECHYVDVATGVKMSDVSFGLLGQPSTGQARRVRGKWLLSFAEVGSPALSSGY
ncbi:MAG TPA: hypothetical protein VFO44_05415 [Steroidobacteraceae bacterium]|nr:hypothetical protein [Steroidobacteraceae bacterium]